MCDMSFKSCGLCFCRIFRNFSHAFFLVYHLSVACTCIHQYEIYPPFRCSRRNSQPPPHTSHQSPHWCPIPYTFFSFLFPFCVFLGCFMLCMVLMYLCHIFFMNFILNRPHFWCLPHYKAFYTSYTRYLSFWWQNPYRLYSNFE